MTKALSKRINRESFYSRLVGYLLRMELKKRSAGHNELRGTPIAVFANDWIGINISVDGIYEGEHIFDLLCLLKNIGSGFSTALDVGANIGNHSIEFSKHFANVICFEPNPRTFNILAANTMHLANVKAYNWGCSSKVEKKKLREDFNNIGGSSSVLDITANNETEISVKPLDEIFDELEDLALIKIDVEGMEYEALKGGEKIISTFHPVVCLEQHESEFDSGHIETAALDWLRSKGYKIFSLRRVNYRNPIIRKFTAFSRMMFGLIESREIVEYERLPRSTYSMVYAVHSTAFSSVE